MPRNPTVRDATKGVPVHLDADVYEALRERAAEDERSICRYTNRLLRQTLSSAASERGRPE